MEDFNAGALPWCEFGNVESGSDRPTTSATFVSAQESLEGPTTPRNVVLQWPPAASIVGALIEALTAATACNDGEAIAAAVMHLAVLLDSACRDDGAAIGAAMRAGSALESLVRLLDHADQRVTQATLLLIGNLSTHDVDEAADATHHAFRALGSFERLLPHAQSTSPLTVMYALGAIRNQMTGLNEVTLLQTSGVLAELQQIAAGRPQAEAGATSVPFADALDHPRLRQFACGCLINVRQILTANELGNANGS